MYSTVYYDRPSMPNCERPSTSSSRDRMPLPDVSMRMNILLAVRIPFMPPRSMILRVDADDADETFEDDASLALGYPSPLAWPPRDMPLPISRKPGSTGCGRLSHDQEYPLMDSDCVDLTPFQNAHCWGGKLCNTSCYATETTANNYIGTCTWW